MRNIKAISFTEEYTNEYINLNKESNASLLVCELLREHYKLNEYSFKGNKRFEGQIVEVLVDGVSKNNELMVSGYSEHNKLVNFEGDSSLVGQLVKVKITKAYSWHLFGEIVK